MNKVRVLEKRIKEKSFMILRELIYFNYYLATEGVKKYFSDFDVFGIPVAYHAHINIEVCLVFVLNKFFSYIIDPDGRSESIANIG